MKVAFYNSLKFRMPLVVLAGILPLRLGVILYATNYAARKISKEERENIKLKTKMLANSVSRWDESNLLALNNLSVQPNIISMDAREQKPVLEALIDKYEHFYRATTINLDGWTLARNDNRKSQYRGDRYYFKTAVKGSDIVAYQALISRTTKRPALCMSQAIYNQKVVGVVMLCSNLEAITKQIGEMRFGETGYAFLVNGNGQVLAHPDSKYLSGKKLKDLRDYTPVKNFLSNQKNDDILFFKDNEGKNWITYYVGVNNGWGVIVVQEGVEFLKSEQEFKNLSFFIAGITLIGLIIITTTLANRLIAPISNLTDVASGIANGEYEGEITINRQDELGLLAQSFNQMIEGIKKSTAELRHAVIHDRLTGLYNRAYFNQELLKLINIFQNKSDYLFAVLFIDLDRFKIINDTLGHETGDRLLIEISHRLKRSVRGEDLVARFGGDEFVILLKKIDSLEKANLIAERIQSELSKPINLKQNEVFITASIGICFSDCDYKNVEDFLRDADTAMYEAKSKGKACYKIFKPIMHQKIKQRLELEKDLRGAIKNSEFELFYQPIIELSSQKITGFEALLRWQHPEKGLISPGEFIPVAEETGQIIEIGWWVLQTACSQLMEWENEYRKGLILSVNISPIQFAQADFTPKIKEIIQEIGFQPQNLILEITESTIIKDLERAKLIIEELIAQNIKIAMDDFGTGYSCLSYLYQLPISKLKIDRSFVQDLEIDRDKLEVIRAIANLGHSLGINLVAEGIETEEQLKIIRELNCTYGQGYLFSKPQTIEKAEALILYQQNLSKTQFLT